jgi:hypothetical protein
MAIFVSCPSCELPVKCHETACPHCNAKLKASDKAFAATAAALILSLGTGSCAVYGVAVTGGQAPEGGSGGSACGEGGAGGEGGADANNCGDGGSGGQ